MGLRPMEKTTLFRGSTYEAGQTKDGVSVLGLQTHSVWESNREEQSPQPGKHPHLQDSSSGGFPPQDTCSPSWGPNSFYFKTFTCVKTGNKVGEKQHPPHSPGVAGSSCGLSPTRPRTGLGRTPQTQPTSRPNPAFPAAVSLKHFDLLVRVNTHMHAHMCPHTGTQAQSWARWLYQVTHAVPRQRGGIWSPMKKLHRENVPNGHVVGGGGTKTRNNLKGLSESCSLISNSLQPHGLYSPRNSPGQNTGVGSLSLLQGILTLNKQNGFTFAFCKAVSAAEKWCLPPRNDIDFCCCSATQSRPTLCDPMDCSIPGFLVFHHFPELVHTHVQGIHKAIQPSHPLLSPSSPAFNLSQHQGLCIRWPKYWNFSFSISPSNEHSGLISFRMDWLDLLAVQGTLKSLHQHHSSRTSVLWRSALFIV